ncbi:MAG: Crp/Fnr family transcriptional regulator [Flavobacteriales bacterium]|nr:Crp/Fnr family transcriptional regulator [Flavobacteriales bacterium]
MSIPITNSDIISLLLQDDKSHEVKLYIKGEQIIKEGANARCVFLQKSGIIKIVKNFDQTDPIIVSFAFPNDLIGLPAVLQSKKYHVTAVAQENVTGWMIDAKKFLEYFEKKGIKKQIVEQMTKETLILMERIGAMAHRSGLKRFLSVLIMLSEVYGTSEDGKLVLNLTIKELSEIVMLSRETMHRIIRDIENEGIISIKSKKITLLNYDKLTRIVEE